MDASESSELASQVNGVHTGIVPERKPVLSHDMVAEFVLKPDLQATSQLSPATSPLHSSEFKLPSESREFAQGFPTQFGISPLYVPSAEHTNCDPQPCK